MKLISIGFGNAVAAGRILAVVSPDSAPIKRVVQEARERGMLLDASFGRRTKSVLLMDTDHIILSSVTPETIAARMEEKNAEETSVQPWKKYRPEQRRAAARAGAVFHIRDLPAHAPGRGRRQELLLRDPRPV